MNEHHSSGNQTVKCASCRKPIKLRPFNDDFPFCSERCRLQDLANWLNESYRISVGHQTTERSLPDD